MENHSQHIVIDIPVEREVPNIAGFSLEENYWMLKIGSDVIHTGKKSMKDSSIIETIRTEIGDYYKTEIEEWKRKLQEAENEVIIHKKIGEQLVLHEEEKIEEEITKRIKYQVDKYAYVEGYNTEEIKRLKDMLMEKEKELLVLKENEKWSDLENNSRVEREISLKLQDHFGKWKDVLQLHDKNTDVFEKAIQKYESLQKLHMEETAKLRELVDKETEKSRVLYEKSIQDMENTKNRLTETEKELIKWKEQYHQVLSDSNFRVEKEVNSKLQMEYEKLKETNDKTQALFEKAIESVNKKQTSNVHIGDKGENMFEEYAAKTFRDFEGFELKNVSNQMYKGDFHLHFKKFSVLADTKYYSNGIDKKQRDKIKHDMIKNQHIQFGWIISLDSSINKYNKAPFQFEWTMENRCICYINNFLKYEDPGEILRAVWFSCSLIYDIAMNRDTESNEMDRLKKNEIRIREIAERIMKNSKERDLTMNQLKENFDTNDKMVREILNVEINQIFQEHYDMVFQWWQENLEYRSGEKMTSNKIYKEFKKTKENMEEIINEDYFKTILYSFLDEINLLKSKGKKVDFLNYGWKSVDAR
jgi:hypothetical protein